MKERFVMDSGIVECGRVGNGMGTVACSHQWHPWSVDSVGSVRNCEWVRKMPFPLLGLHGPCTSVPAWRCQAR